MTAQEHQSCHCSSQGELSASISPCLDLIMQARLAGRQLLAKETEASSITARLLERLLHITACSKGALLVPAPRPSMARHARIVLSHFPVLSLSSSADSEEWYLLASQDVRVEEVRRAIMQQDTKRYPDQSLSGITGHAFYHLPITAPSQAILEMEMPPLEANSPDKAEVYEHRPLLPSHAVLLLFGNGRMPEETRSQSMKPAFPVSLPTCIQEAAGTVLLMLFLAPVDRSSPVIDPVFFPEREEQQAELQAALNHELRSPLAAIKGYVGTLLRHEQRLQPEERHDFLLAIDDASTRLTDIIHHLLELSELETGSVLLTWSRVNVVALVRESLLAAKLRWGQEHTFSLSVVDQNGLSSLDEPVIEADQQRLREVFDHVLHNALKYSPAGEAIEVTVRQVPDMERQARLEEKRSSRVSWSYALATSSVLEISVRDHGIGIPQHAQERIFDRFGRVDMSLTREVNGLGLGLAICQQIVALHQGIIWAESDVGKGSTFHIWLPWKKEGW